MDEQRVAIEMISTGVGGFDDITGGGLPRGRVTVVMGGAGSGKTIFALQVLANGAGKRSEKGLFVAFEESAAHILPHAAHFEWSDQIGATSNVEIFDANLSQAVLKGGDFDLIGLLAVLDAKVRKTGAKRIVLDGLDVLLAYLENAHAIRREIFRIREWLDSSGLTAIVTAKARDGAPLSSDYDFLEFMADCVIILGHQVTSGTALRYVRVAKLRGNAHSANELPFSIGHSGIEVAAGGRAGELDYPVSTERISSGVPRLDTMLSGGYFRGSSVLVTGAPGTAKTSLAAAFADAACRRGERTVFLSFDEGPQQIIRNVSSIGIDFRPHVASGVLRMSSLRARGGSPESHVAHVRALLREHDARNLVVDPLSALANGVGADLGEQAAIQMLDIAKANGTTVISTSLLGTAKPLSEESPLGISTIADTWMHLSYVNNGGERNRALTIIKSRGTGHSNQVRELVLSESGLSLAEVYTVGGEVLMGTLRWEKEAEARRAQENARRAMLIKERDAELALAEGRVRLQAITREVTLREAEIERIQSELIEDKGRNSSDAGELRRLRGSDERTEGPSGGAQ